MSEYERIPHDEISLGDALYPQQLVLTKHPPKRLYVLGDPSLLNNGSLGIVGARKATPYGLECADFFASRAAALDITIVSGAAIGCDQAATRAAVRQKKPAVIVLAGGADNIYPSSARELLLEVVASGGVIVSEQPWGTKPLRPYFVQRNRIIAGLSRALLVVEAGMASGTFTTADYALEAGRDVLVVPGSIHSPESKGSNRLLYQGAQPIIDGETFDSVASALFGVMPLAFGRDIEKNVRSGLTTADAHLVAALAANPMRLEQMADKLDIKASKIAATISRLESIGAVEKSRDGRYGVPLSAL